MHECTSVSTSKSQGSDYPVLFKVREHRCGNHHQNDGFLPLHFYLHLQGRIWWETWNVVVSCLWIPCCPTEDIHSLGKKKLISKIWHDCNSPSTPSISAFSLLREESMGGRSTNLLSDLSVLLDPVLMGTPRTEVCNRKHCIRKYLFLPSSF